MSSQKIVVYRARPSMSEWRKRIEKLEVDRLTDKTFWMDGSRHPRRTLDSFSWYCICNTFEEAKQVVIDAMQAEINILNQQIGKANGVILEMNNLQEPLVPFSSDCY